MKVDPKPVRPCGDCSKCCQGTLAATVLGQEIGVGKHCSYLGPKGKGCTIHNYRPSVCKQFICEWKSNYNFPEHLRPDKTGVILSVRYFVGADGNAYEHLRVFDTNKKANKEVYDWVKTQFDKKVYERVLYIILGVFRRAEYGILTYDKNFYEQMGNHLGGFENVKTIE